jgi:hypothetical protein
LLSSARPRKGIGLDDVFVVSQVHSHMKAYEDGLVSAVACHFVNGECPEGESITEIGHCRPWDPWGMCGDDVPSNRLILNALICIRCGFATRREGECPCSWRSVGAAIDDENPTLSNADCRAFAVANNYGSRPLSLFAALCRTPACFDSIDQNVFDTCNRAAWLSMRFQRNRLVHSACVIQRQTRKWLYQPGRGVVFLRAQAGFVGELAGGAAA